MKPLAGVRVIDLTHMIAGPMATQILGDLGAEVIKVESPGRGDVTRGMPPFDRDISHYFLAFNKFKKSVAIDIKHPQGKEVLLELLGAADVVVENFAAGVMDRLGFGPDLLSAKFPHLIQCSISGFGQTGPLKDKKSYDLVAQAAAGVMSVNGEAHGPPLKVGIPIGDTCSALYAVIGILAAIVRKRAGGPGARLDLSLHDCLVGLLANHAAYFFATGTQAPRTGSHHYMSFPNGRYATKDGDVVVAVATEAMWRDFSLALGLAHLLDDARCANVQTRRTHRDELEILLAARIQTLSTQELVERLDDVGIPCSPVHDVAHAVQDPHTLFRGMVQDVTDGKGTHFRTLASPLPGLRCEVATCPPQLGEHTLEVLRAMGYSDVHLDALRASDAILQS